MKKVMSIIAMTVLAMACIFTSCDDETIYETVTEQITDTLFLPQDTLYLPQDTVNITDPVLIKQAAIEGALEKYILDNNSNYTNVSVEMFSKIKDVEGYDISYLYCAWTYTDENNNPLSSTEIYYISNDLKVILGGKISSELFESTFADYKLTES